MKDGLVFVWVEKEFIADIINYFDQDDGHNLKYVENVCFVMLDQNKKQGKF